MQILCKIAFLCKTSCSCFCLFNVLSSNKKRFNFDQHSFLNSHANMFLCFLLKEDNGQYIRHFFRLIQFLEKSSRFVFFFQVVVHEVIEVSQNMDIVACICQSKLTFDTFQFLFKIIYLDSFGLKIGKLHKFKSGNSKVATFK